MKRMNRKLLTGLLVGGIGAAALGTAVAGPYWHGGPGHGPGHMWGGGPCWAYDGGASAAGWQEVAKKRTDGLHDAMKLNAQQEKLWKNYQAALSAEVKARQERELTDFSGMTAPERLEMRQKMMKERDARMEKHLEALKAFYASLTPEQQEIFESAAGAGPGPAGPGYHRGGRWHRGGPR